MADTLVRKVMLQITGDDADAAAKLDAIAARAEELKKLNPELSVRIDTAVASAKMAVFRGELKATAAEMDDLKAKSDREEAGGIIGRFLGGSGGSGGFLGGLTGILGKLPLVGGAFDGIASSAGQAGEESGSLLGSLGSIAGSGFALGAVAIAVGGIVTELAALASGFTAAGLGLGAVALVALPFFKQVTGALGDTQAQLAKQPWYIQQTVAELKNVKSQFEGISQALAPQISNVASQALGILSDHMDLLGKFAQAALPAVSGVLGMLSKGLDSKSFKDFASYMEQLSGPAITAIGSGMAGLAKDVMQLLTVMSQKDVINGINIAFRVLGFTITAVIDVIKYMMWGWDNLTKIIHDTASVFDTVRHTIAAAGHDIASTFDTVRHAAATAGHDIAVGFDAARHGVATAADGIKNAVVSAVTRVETMVRNDWKNVAAWLTDPVFMAAHEIHTHLHEIAQDFDAVRHDTAAILAGARHDIAAVFDGIRHDVAAIVVGIPGDVRKQWDMVRHDAAAFGAGLLHDAESIFSSVWHYITSTTSSGAAQTAGFFQALPGKILGFLAGLPGQMLTVGENIIIAIYNGIVRQFNSLISSVSSIAHDLANAIGSPFGIHFSEPSEAVLMVKAGQRIPAGLAKGAEESAAAARVSMGRTMAAVTAGAAAGAGAAGAGGGQKLQLEFTGNANDPLWALFKKNIRVRGGNVQIVGA